MSGEASTAQNEWVVRVLGAVLPDGGGATAPATARPLSLVKLGKARVEFIGTQQRAVGEIKRLRQTLQTKFAGDASQSGQLGKADATLAALQDDLDSTLNDELDAVLTAEPGRRPPLIATARATLERLTGLVSSDPIMAELDGNELAPEMQVTAPLAARLRAIADALG